MAERDHLIGVNVNAPGYAEDYAAWINSQAQLLRERRFRHLDLDNLIDEVESLGRSDYAAFVSAIEIVLVKMLKWDAQPARRTAGWIASIEEHRRRVARSLRDNPSYKARVGDALARAFETAVPRAAAETNLPLSSFPADMPFTWDAVMTRDHALPA